MNEGQNQNPAEADRRTELRSRIRPLSGDAPDEVFLPFLELCFNWSMDKPRVEVADLLEREDAAFYFKDWGRHGDIAVAAYASGPDAGRAADEGSGPEIVGLAWLRLAEIEAVIERSTRDTVGRDFATGDTTTVKTATDATDTATTNRADTATGDTATGDTATGNATDSATTGEAGSRFTGYGWVAADIPELSLAVLPEHQSQGLGSMLLDVVCALAKMSGFHAVSLSAEDGNGAARLYHDRGFVAVGRNGDSDILVRKLR